MTITEQGVVTGHVVTAGIYHFLLLRSILYSLCFPHATQLVVVLCLAG